MSSILMGVLNVVMAGRIKTIAQGAATTCLVAADPALEGVSGYYFSD
jgi:hypothetical protein